MATKTASPPAEPVSTDAGLDLLRELVAEVRGLRADLREKITDRKSFSSLNRHDRALLARLLPVIGGAFGSELFVVRELYESDAEALVIARQGLTRAQLGRLFKRAEKQPVDGYVVISGDLELNVRLWKVMRVPEGSSLSIPPRLDVDRR